MDHPRICATVTGASAEALRAARCAAEHEADLVELRLDTMERPDPEAGLNGRTRPAIVTCRAVARTLADLVPLLGAHSPTDSILIGMGSPGVASRILAGRFGSPW